MQTRLRLGQYAEPLSPLNEKPVGADGCVVSTMTVVVIEVVLPTLSVPVSVSR